MFIFSAAPFYIYMILSAAFRRDFIQLMVITYRKLRKRLFDRPDTWANTRMTRKEPRV